MRVHGDAIEADLQRHYGIDLCDLWRGTLTLRKLRVLVEHLPNDCATAYALMGDAYTAAAGWTMTDLLLARVGDELAAYRWQWESAHIDPKKGRLRAPPTPVTPEVAPRQESNVIPLVRPSQLGDFVHDRDDQEVTPDAR